MARSSYPNIGKSGKKTSALGSHVGRVGTLLGSGQAAAQRRARGLSRDSYGARGVWKPPMFPGGQTGN